MAKDILRVHSTIWPAILFVSGRAAERHVEIGLLRIGTLIRPRKSVLTTQATMHVPTILGWIRKFAKAVDVGMRLSGMQA